MSTFNETCEPTSRKYVAKQGIVMLRWLKTFQTFRLHFPVFALETQPKILNFQSFFTSNRLFGGYFQWNACRDFQKICIWARYSDAKFIKNISKFWVALLHFSCRKTTGKSKFSESFLLLIGPLEKQPKNLHFQSFFFL